MPAPLALRGVVGNFAHLADVLADPFYRSGAGLDAPLRHAAAIARACLALALGAGAFALADRLASATGRPRALALVAGAGLLAVLVWRPRAAGWPLLLRALPVVAALGCAAASLAAWRLRGDPAAARARLVLALWSLLALGLLGKLGLAARVTHYGFTLAMPATLLLAALAVGALPAWLRARGSSGEVARALALAAVAGFAWFWFEQSDRIYARSDYPIGRGGDAILAPEPALQPRSRHVAQTLAWLERHSPADSTLLVLPEGVMLNYWLRRKNPTRFDLFLPTEMAAFGEAEMLRDLAAHPPDTIVLMHRLPDEFGVGPFGSDPRNGRALLDWVRANYQRVAAFGPEPFGTQGFGTRIFARGPAPGAPGSGASDAGPSLR
jgi:hypothetical protein